MHPSWARKLPPSSFGLQLSQAVEIALLLILIDIIMWYYHSSHANLSFDKLRTNVLLLGTPSVRKCGLLIFAELPEMVPKLEGGIYHPDNETQWRSLR